MEEANSDEIIAKSRPLRAQLGITRNNDGSCALEQGSTLIFCGLNGPGDSPSSKRLNDRLFIEIIYKKPTPTNCNKVKKLISSVVEDTITCTKYPRSILTLTMHEIQADGSEPYFLIYPEKRDIFSRFLFFFAQFHQMAAGLTSACLALLDSGVAMNGIFCGVCVAVSDEKFHVDPSRKIVQKSTAVFTVAVKSSSSGKKVVGVETEGKFNFDQYMTAISLAVKASNDIFIFYRESLQRKLSVDFWT